MKGNSRLIEALNEILTAELTGINQYFVHSMMCANWGFQRLAAKIRTESISEMKHAEQLIERILHLEGLPSVQRLDKVKIGETVVAQLKLDLALEVDAIGRLNRVIALAVEVGDNSTRELLEGILRTEDDHLHFLESQLELVNQIGEANYLAQQVYPD